jgi:predicted RecA/RadA family phage recombinase
MKNFVQDGKSVDFTAPAGGVVAGSFYLIGAAIVVAATTQVAGATFAGWLTGTYTVPAATGQAWIEGAKLYWDDTAKNFTTTVGSNTKAGIAAVAKLSATAIGQIRLIPTI